MVRRSDGSGLTSNSEVLSGGVLRITRVTGPEAGSYQCVAENVAGRAQLVAELIIQTPPSARLQPSGSVQVLLGSALQLRCEVGGDPQPRLTWRRIGAEGPREVGWEEVYQIAAVRREDEGTYACLASSVAGEVEERVQVLVLEAGEEERGGQGPQENPLVQSPGGRGRDYVTALGGDLRLEAEVVGQLSGLSVMWRRQDGRPLPPRHTQQGGVLYLQQVDRQDAGVYICHGVDTRGVTVFEFLANLVIAAAPQIRLEPEQQTVRAGHWTTGYCSCSCHLSCSCSCHLSCHLLSHLLPPGEAGRLPQHLLLPGGRGPSSGHTLDQGGGRLPALLRTAEGRCAPGMLLLLLPHCSTPDLTSSSVPGHRSLGRRSLRLQSFKHCRRLSGCRFSRSQWSE